MGSSEVSETFFAIVERIYSFFLPLLTDGRYCFICLFYLPYLSSIHEKAMYRYTLDGKSALAWELPFSRFMGHLSST